MKEKYCLHKLKKFKDAINSLDNTVQRIIKCIEEGNLKNLIRAADFDRPNRISSAFYFAHNRTINNRYEMVKNSLQKINDQFQTNILPNQVEIVGKYNSTQQETDNINKNSDHLLPETANNSGTKANEVLPQEVPAKVEAKNSNGAPVQEILNISETKTL